MRSRSDTSAIIYEQLLVGYPFCNVGKMYLFLLFSPYILYESNVVERILCNRTICADYTAINK